MNGLALQVGDVDLRHFETVSADRSWQALLQITCRMVTDARSLVGSILAACDPVLDGGERPTDDAATLNAPLLPFERAIDAAVEGAGEGVASSVRAVEDIAFLVQLELRQRAERLGRICESSGALTVIGECDGALRRIRKGLAAIDLAIARAEGVAPSLDFSSELQQSLRVRQAYARFRARVLALGENESTLQLYPRMRAAGTHIAMLIGWDAYPILRVRDRLQLRELQQRILLWLRPEHREDCVAGTRLWQDVVGFVEMLALVNRRQELVEHDSRLLAEVLSRPSGPRVEESAAGRLRALEGLDEDLDRLLQAEAPPADGAWREALEKIAARFGLAREGEA